MDHLNLIETLMRIEILAKIHVHTPWKKIQDGGHSSQFLANKIVLFVTKASKPVLNSFSPRYITMLKV